MQSVCFSCFCRTDELLLEGTSRLGERIICAGSLLDEKEYLKSAFMFFLMSKYETEEYEMKLIQAKTRV